MINQINTHGPASSSRKSSKKVMSTWRMAGELIRGRLPMWSLDSLGWGLVWLLPAVAGYIVKLVFDVITGERVSLLGFQFEGADSEASRLLGTTDPAAGLAAASQTTLDSGLLTLLAVIVGIGLARVCIIVGSIHINSTFFHTIGAVMRINALDHVLSRPGAKALSESPGKSVSRFRDDVEDLQHATEWTVDLVGMIVTAIFCLVVMGSINAQITRLVFLPLLVIVAVVNILRAKLEAYRLASRAATSKVTGFLGETFGSVQAVKVATAESSMISRFDDMNEVRRVAALKDTLLTSVLGTVFNSSVNLGTGLILVLTAGLIRTGEFGVGDLAMFVVLLTRLTDVMFHLGIMLAWHKQAAVARNRLMHVIGDLPAEEIVAHREVDLDRKQGPLAYSPPDKSQRLERFGVRNLSYRHEASETGIDDISLEISPGEFVVVTGRVGSGKTTLLRCLLGLLPVQTADFEWNGKRMDSPADFLVPPRCAYTSQVPQLFSTSLRENLLMGVPESEVDLDQAIHKAVMERDLGQLDQGLDTIVGPRGVKLSGGQLQRAAAARMFVREPELLVFDDLSSALDVETEAKLWERIFEGLSKDGGAAPNSDEAQRPACLVVSHRRPALKRADRILLLDAGRIVDRGSLDELLERSALMRKLWEGTSENPA